MVVASRRCALLGLLLGACASLPYAACPVELEGDLPADAFARCKRLLGTRYGGITIADEAAFLLQTTWTMVAEPQGERRASVFLESGQLAVVVESRWLAEPLVGLPRWSSVRGDPFAERELAELLAAELRPATEPAPGPPAAAAR